MIGQEGIAPRRQGCRQCLRAIDDAGVEFRDVAQSSVIENLDIRHFVAEQRNDSQLIGCRHIECHLPSARESIDRDLWRDDTDKANFATLDRLKNLERTITTLRHGPGIASAEFPDEIPVHIKHGDQEVRLVVEAVYAEEYDKPVRAAKSICRQRKIAHIEERASRRNGNRILVAGKEIRSAIIETGLYDNVGIRISRRNRARHEERSVEINRNDVGIGVERTDFDDRDLAGGRRPIGILPGKCPTVIHREPLYAEQFLIGGGFGSGRIGPRLTFFGRKCQQIVHVIERDRNACNLATDDVNRIGYTIAIRIIEPERGRIGGIRIRTRIVEKLCGGGPIRPILYTGNSERTGVIGDDGSGLNIAVSPVNPVAASIDEDIAIQQYDDRFSRSRHCRRALRGNLRTSRIHRLFQEGEVVGLQRDVGLDVLVCSPSERHAGLDATGGDRRALLCRCSRYHRTAHATCAKSRCHGITNDERMNRFSGCRELIKIPTAETHPEVVRVGFEVGHGIGEGPSVIAQDEVIRIVFDIGRWMCLDQLSNLPRVDGLVEGETDSRRFTHEDLIVDRRTRDQRDVTLQGRQVKTVGVPE